MKFNPRRSGVFIVIEGVDGAGKSTAIKLISKFIQEKYPDRKVVCLRTPNGPIREVLLNRTEDFPAEAELLLYIASHVSTYANFIRKALDENAIVVCDRFIDSTRAYQGIGRGLQAQVRTLINTYLSDKLPDHTVYIQADPNVCQARLDARQSPDYMDLEKAEFKLKVNQGMRDICSQNLTDTSENRFSLIINNTTLTDLENICKYWVESVMSVQKTQTQSFDASELPAIVLPKLSVQDYLNVLRKHISVAYMSTSRLERYMSKPNYVPNWIDIVNLSEGCGVYKYEPNSHSFNNPADQPFEINQNSLYCCIETDNLEIVTNLSDRAHKTYWRSKRSLSNQDWFIWDVDLTLPINPHHLKHLLENNV